MTLEEELRLSYYKRISTLNEEVAFKILREKDYHTIKEIDPVVI